MKNKKTLIVILLLFIIGISLYMISHRSWFSPDQFFFLALLGSAVVGRVRIFLFDWIPFLLSYFGYEFMRGLVPYISGKVHILGMIRFDQALFGYIPAVKFQSLFYNPGQPQWYDYVSAIVYVCHFVTPMIVGYLFWLKDRKIFKEFAIAFLLLSYAGLITFALFPAMPPWMASDMGYIQVKIPQTLGPIMSHFPTMQVNFPTIYQYMASDPVAAVPSLHAAFPLLILLYLVKKFKTAGLLFLPYVVTVWFAVMYLGEHYFIDVLIGAVYAVVVFLIVEKRRFLLTSFRKLLSNLKISFNIV